MAERGISYSPEMIKAKKLGKCMTRRVVKPQPSHVWGYGEHMSDGVFRAHVRYAGGQQPDPYITCPYGQKGDRLWVKEAWLNDGTEDHPVIHYKTDDTIVSRSWNGSGLWKSPRFMPHRFSRFVDEITEVRCERVQEITDVEAVDEGVISLGQAWVCQHFPDYAKELLQWRRDLALGISAIKGPLGPSPRERFAALWNSLHAKPKPVRNKFGWIDHYVSYPWEDVQETRQHRSKPWHVHGNPFVWVLATKPVEVPSA